MNDWRNSVSTMNPEEIGKIIHDAFNYADLKPFRQFENETALPPIDIREWAKSQGLKISEDGRTLTCYKTVHKWLDGTLHSLHDCNFVYKVGEFAVANDLDHNRFHSCSNGLHGCNLKEAIYYDETGTVLELKVDISDPENYVVPYEFKFTGLEPSYKFRFKKCFVVKEVPVKAMWVNLETNEMWPVSGD